MEECPVNDAILRLVAAEEAENKRKTLSQPERVEEKQRETNAGTAKRQRTAELSLSTDTADDVITGGHSSNTDQREERAAAAESRRDDCRSKGIGNLSTLDALERKSAKRDSLASSNCFGNFLSESATKKLRRELGKKRLLQGKILPLHLQSLSERKPRQFPRALRKPKNLP